MTSAAVVRVLLDESQLNEGVVQLAGSIDAYYDSAKPLTVIAVMTGSLVLFADLIRRLSMPQRVGVVRASSYRGGTSAGELKIDADMMIDVAGRDVLNVFSYTGGFAINAAASGASRITNIDSSSTMLKTARENIKLNGWDRPDDEYINRDAFQSLRQLRDEGRQFDVVIVDPPKFAHSKGDVPAACRGYKDINLLAMQLLRRNGLLATFSCSGLIDAGLFQKVLFGASVDAGRDVQIVQLLSQAADHPVLLTFPESSYLKGFICRVY